MSDIHDLEDNIEEAKKLIERRQMAMKLAQNPEFKVLILEGWLLHDAARLIQMATDPRVDLTIQTACQEEARATGFMRRYLSDCIQMGAVAERDLPEMMIELDELRAEELRQSNAPQPSEDE